LSEKELRFVKAKGSRFEIGKQIGMQCRDQAARVVESRMRNSGAWEKLLSNAKKSLPYAIEFDPNYVEELQGYAEGTEIAFNNLFAGLFGPLSYGGGRFGCTTVALGQGAVLDRTVLHAHNEDCFTFMEENLSLVMVEPSNEPSFIAVSYCGIIPTAGFNSEGISVSDNSVNPNDVKEVGVSAMFPVRKVLSSRTLGEALTSDVPEHKAEGSNQMICHSSGEIYDIEASATNFDVIYQTDGYLVHTNHYESAKMKRYEGNLEAALNSSVFRYNRASRLVREKLGKITIDDLKKIMSDHVNLPSSICRHSDNRKTAMEQSKTICSVIMDLTHMQFYVCRGNPCEGQHVIHSLTSH
jgi:isopenicillin-N N-acyltransferase-like protein